MSHISRIHNLPSGKSLAVEMNLNDGSIGGGSGSSEGTMVCTHTHMHTNNSYMNAAVQTGRGTAFEL